MSDDESGEWVVKQKVIQHSLPRLPRSSGRWYRGSSGRWYWGQQRPQSSRYMFKSFWNQRPPFYTPNSQKILIDPMNPV